MKNTLERVPGYRRGLVRSVASRLAEGIVTDAASGSMANRPVTALPEVVLGRDDRVRVANVNDYPWRAICALQITARNGQSFVGTGWFIGPHTLATAGHCVYMHDAGGWAESIEVIPGLDGARAPFGRFNSRRFHTVDQWIADQDTNYDYGVIELDEDAGQQVGYFAIGTFNEADLTQTEANLAGYPADRDSATRQYYHARIIQKVSASKLFYDIDTYGGQSGSPVWLDLGAQGRVAVGIHTTGSSRGNSATRVTREVLGDLRAWKNE